MREASKSRRIWGELESRVLTGTGIDIGCGPDPVRPDVRRFDIADGDANVITQHVTQQFDFVYSSHCLEHMRDPRATLLEWWAIVKPGGYLFITVPDEDLYEQGVFPSRYNSDHKATFTVFKEGSWSPCSVNLRPLLESLPGGTILKLEVQDDGYDRSLLTYGSLPPPSVVVRLVRAAYLRLLRPLGLRLRRLDRVIASVHPGFDQTLHNNALAQIACIVRKAGSSTS